MNALLTFLTVVLPQAPQLASLFRSAFVQVGGTEADFDRILAENDLDIAKLGNPDQFRKSRPRAAVKSTKKATRATTKKKPSRAKTGVVTLLLAAALSITSSVSAQTYPLPSKVGTPKTICTACEGLNSAGEPNANKPTPQFTNPIADFTGRIVDSQATPNIQHVGMRTGRAGIVRTAYDKRGSTQPRVYAYIGLATFGAYDLGSFVKRLQDGVLKPVSVINTGARFGARSPLERILSPHGWVYPEAKNSRWQVPFVDRTEKLKDFDFDDRGLVYLAYDIFGWGIVKDTGQVGVSMLPLVEGSQQLGLEVDRIVSLSSGGKYYVATSASGNVLAGRLLYDVTDANQPKLISHTKDQAGFQSVIRMWSKDDNARTLAVITADGDLRVWTYDGYVRNEQPIKVLTSRTGFAALSFDNHGVLWVIEKPLSSPASAPTRVLRLVRTQLEGYKETAMLPFPEPFRPIGLHARGGYVAVFGSVKRKGLNRNTIYLFKVDKDGGLDNLDTQDFFLKYYHAAPSGFAQPKGYNGSPQDVHLLTPGDDKVYLMYMNYGLGDVYELGDGKPVGVPPVVEEPKPDEPKPGPKPECKCECRCPETSGG